MSDKSESKESKVSIKDLAATLYDANLPYHNFQHALRAAERGKEIAERCIEEAVEINVMVVYYALLFHDAGYHENFQEKGFKTREEYAAFLAGQTLTQAGLKDDLIWDVQKAIISTNRDDDFTTNEEKAVRAADLSSMADDYETFLDNTRQLKQEAETLGGQKISWTVWKKNTEKLINFYLQQDIHLTTAYVNEDGQSVFHQRAKANLKRFLEEDDDKLDRV